MSFTPNMGAGETTTTASSPMISCWKSVSDSQSIRPDGWLRRISLRQRCVRVSRTTSLGEVGRL